MRSKAELWIGWRGVRAATLLESGAAEVGPLSAYCGEPLDMRWIVSGQPLDGEIQAARWHVWNQRLFLYTV